MRFLAEWKDRKNRKPLVLEGARQVGKTWLVREFGKSSFDRTAYISLQNNERMEQLFSGDIKPQRLIPALSLESGVAIESGTTLIVLDEVQEVPRALTALKYFYEEAPEYAVIATGSSLGIALHPGTSFPVGKVEAARLYPFCFREFLMARGEQGLADVVANMDPDMMTLFHNRLMEELKYFFVVGGMPEAVKTFVETYPGVDFKAITSVQKQIVESYRDDFSKHESSAPRGLTLRLNQVWDSIPSQLAKENKKFVYGLVKQGGRRRDFELAIQWLVDTSLVLKVPRVSTPRYPLKMHEDLSAFKLYLCDVGLLRTMGGIEPEIVLEGDAVFNAAKGALAEQFACQELLATGKVPYYWAAKNATSELDFVLQHNGCVAPLEVKAGRNLKAKSLKASINRFGFESAYRFSTLPPRHDGVVYDLPLYTIGEFAAR